MCSKYKIQNQNYAIFNELKLRHMCFVLFSYNIDVILLI